VLYQLSYVGSPRSPCKVLALATCESRRKAEMGSGRGPKRGLFRSDHGPRSFQAMFSPALEWGEASSNPVALVRKSRQGRQRPIDVMDPMLIGDGIEVFSRSSDEAGTVAYVTAPG
jgi:hypothetical protein